MDLLGSILDSMDKPPTASEKEREEEKKLRAKIEREERKEKKEKEEFKKKAEAKIEQFMEDPMRRKLKFPPAEKLFRAILHEIAEAAGLLSFSFGTEGHDRHVILFRKEQPPSDEELAALRAGDEDYDPTKHEAVADEVTTATIPESRQPEATPTMGHYQEKYKHLLGGLECAEQSAVKMEPNKAFGYGEAGWYSACRGVPSSHKRDLRSIEQTLNDMRSRKKPKLDTSTSDRAQQFSTNTDTLNSEGNTGTNG